MSLCGTIYCCLMFTWAHFLRGFTHWWKFSHIHITTNWKKSLVKFRTYRVDNDWVCACLSIRTSSKSPVWIARWGTFSPEIWRNTFNAHGKKLNSRMNRILRETNRECVNEIEALAPKPKKRRTVSFTFLFLVWRSNLTTRGVFLDCLLHYRRSKKRYVFKKKCCSFFQIRVFSWSYFNSYKKKKNEILTLFPAAVVIFFTIPGGTLGLSSLYSLEITNNE